jgi:predicted Rossmann-fold nucleotide-binding protein
VPVLLFGSDYWKKIINMTAMVEEGTISAEDAQCFEYVDDPALAWARIEAFYNL